MTWKGLHPVVEVVTTAYQTGVRLTKEAMAAVEAQLDRLPGLDKWFVDILYQPAAAQSTYLFVVPLVDRDWRSVATI
jgi:hypothetical protein